MKHEDVKHAFFVLAAATVLSLAACKQQPTDPATDPAADSSAAAAQATAAAADTDAASADDAAGDDAVADAATGDEQAAVEPSEEQRARAEQQAKLDYATMENDYINDASAQWATEASASATAGDGEKPDSWAKPWQATGPVNNEEWLSGSKDVGFDWLQLSYLRPVSATGVRVAFSDGLGAQAITRIELIDTDGKPHVIWAGLSDATDDERGKRTWFVKSFEATPYQVEGVKLTFANNVESGTQVDAVQLVGG